MLRYNICPLITIVGLTWAFCCLLDRAIEIELRQPTRAQLAAQDRASATTWLSDDAHVRYSARLPKVPR